MKFDPKSGELIPFQRKTVFNPKKGMIEEVPVLPKGEAGMVGPIGPIGPKGDKGDQGERGEKGERGDIGPVGPQGNEGPRGPTGMVGPTGPTGPRGEKGEKGDSIPLEEYPIIHKTALKPKDSFGKNGDWAFADTEELVQAIGTYLLQKPMAEVRHLVEALEKQLVLLEEKQEEKGE